MQEKGTENKNSVCVLISFFSFFVLNSKSNLFKAFY